MKAYGEISGAFRKKKLIRMKKLDKGKTESCRRERH